MRGIGLGLGLESVVASANISGAVDPISAILQPGDAWWQPGSGPFASPFDSTAPADESAQSLSTPEDPAESGGVWDFVPNQGLRTAGSPFIDAIENSAAFAVISYTGALSNGFRAVAGGYNSGAGGGGNGRWIIGFDTTTSEIYSFKNDGANPGVENSGLVPPNDGTLFYYEWRNQSGANGETMRWDEAEYAAGGRAGGNIEPIPTSIGCGRDDSTFSLRANIHEIIVLNRYPSAEDTQTIRDAWRDKYFPLTRSRDPALAALENAGSGPAWYARDAMNELLLDLRAATSALQYVLPLVGWNTFGTIKPLVEPGSVGAPTYNSFVEADYLAKGALAGLTGDGTKDLDIGYADADLFPGSEGFAIMLMPGGATSVSGIRGFFGHNSGSRTHVAMNFGAKGLGRQQSTSAVADALFDPTSGVAALERAGGNISIWDGTRLTTSAIASGTPDAATHHAFSRDGTNKTAGRGALLVYCSLATYDQPSRDAVRTACETFLTTIQGL